MATAYESLIALAEYRMKKSKDPLHNHAHVLRVLQVSKDIAYTKKLSSKELQALVLAVWWHDVSRSYFRRTAAFVILRFCDDFLSSIALWVASIRMGYFGAVPGMACRIIFCKNIGTGTIFTRLILRKKTRTILHILSDADKIDMLHKERIETFRTLSTKGFLFAFIYRTWFFWLKFTRDLCMKTPEGKKAHRAMCSHTLAWYSQKEVHLWHEKTYGKKWVVRTEKHWQKLITG